MVDKGAWIVDAEAGLIHSCHTGRRLAAKPKKSGYHMVGVLDVAAQHMYTMYLSRVIWESVCGEIPDGLQVNHKDGNKSNNSLSNFELTTCRENIVHAHETGLWPSVIRGPLAPQIEAALDQGLSHPEIASAFRVGTGTVHRVRARRPGYALPRVRTPNDPEKICTKCRETKPLGAFHRRNNGSRDGRASHCADCVRPVLRANARARREAAKNLE